LRSLRSFAASLARIACHCSTESPSCRSVLHAWPRTCSPTIVQKTPYGGFSGTMALDVGSREAIEVGGSLVEHCPRVSAKHPCPRPNPQVGRAVSWATSFRRDYPSRPAFWRKIPMPTSASPSITAVAPPSGTEVLTLSISNELVVG